MEKKYRYKAFISYRHNEEDMKVAEHLHNAIERYHIPKSIRESIGFDGNMDVFRDKYDLPVTDSLNDTIGNALRDSEYLIVICSTHLKESVWVDKEIEIFLRTHPRNNIFTVLVDGEPYEVIPKVLLTEEVEEVTNTGETVIVKRDLEPLSADYRSGIKNARKTELHRLVAGLLGCTYEDLMLRQQKYRNRVMASVAVGVASLMAIAISYVLWSNTRINDNYKKSLFNRSEYLSEESIRIRTEENNKGLAIQLALNAVPEDGNDMPYNPHAQFALSTALDAYSLPSDNYSGVNYFEAEMGEKFSMVIQNEKGTLLAAISSPSFFRYILYLWDTKENKLIAKHYFDEECIFDEMYFSNNYLWLVSDHGLYIYSLSNGELTKKIEHELSPQDIYLNGKNLYFFQKTRLQVYDVDTMEIVSEINFEKKLNHSTTLNIMVSPDDKYFALCYYSSDKKYNTYLSIIDLTSKKLLLNKKLLDENSNVSDLCFAHGNIIIGTIRETSEAKGKTIPEFSYYSHTHLNKTLMCFDCSSGDLIWKNQISDRQLKLGELNRFQILFSHIKVSDSNKYIDTVVALDKNIVYFLNPKSGEIIQKEELPYNQYFLAKANTYENMKSISLLETDMYVLLSLCFDDDASSTSLNTLSIKRPDLDFINADLENPYFLATFGDEIIQYQKNDGDLDYIMLDKDFFSGEIKEQFDFGNYMALIVTKDDEKTEFVTEGELRVYDLKAKKISNTIPLKNSYLDFIGIVENKYLVLAKSGNSTFYKYNIRTKKLAEIDLSNKLKKISGNNVFDFKIIDKDLYILVEEIIQNDTDVKNELYPVIYHMEKDTIETLQKPARLELFESVEKAVFNNDGTKAYIEYYNGTNELADFGAGSIYKLNDIFNNKTKHLEWNKHQMGAYDGKKLLVYDVDKKKTLIEVDDSYIASFTLTDEYLYYLEVSGNINKVSINDGKRQSSYLKKYSKYKELNLMPIEDPNDSFWCIKDNIIRILVPYINERIMLEIDSDTLELIGQYHDIYTYNKDNNSYCVGEKDSSSSNNEESMHKLALFKCYNLNTMIKKGKKYIKNKELNERQKMRYGIE